MEWTIEYRQSESVLYIKTRGKVTTESANKMVAEIVAEMNQHQCRGHIVDHREAVFEFKFADYYDRPEINRQLGLSPTWKIAMVFKSLTEDTRFLETVFRNRGFNFREFTDLTEAESWLFSE